MRTNDGRKLNHDVLEEIRKRAVQQVGEGESPEDVVRTLGFCRATIYNWLAKYREGGMDALKAKPLSGRPPKLEEAPAMALQDYRRQEPIAVGFRVCVMDSGNDRGID